MGHQIKSKQLLAAAISIQIYFKQIIFVVYD